MTPPGRAISAILLCFAGCSLSPHVKPGIDHELARVRAASIENVRYGLVFRMISGMKAVRGEATITFDLAAKQDVVIDFAGEDMADVRVNGSAVEIEVVHNHIVIDAGDVRAGENTFHATFTSKVAPTGTPLTVYHDRADESEYYYTLVVPADAHRLFPCFDQPDIKGTYALSIEAPTAWKVIANGEELSRSSSSDKALALRQFAVTKPLSTYLFAFAGGPFEQLERPGSTPPMRMFVRKSKIEKLQREVLFKMHEDSARWLGDYFRYPYPFGKLDFVLVPGFPYGGMEHSGAIFYRESALVFEQQPTESELSRRSTLIYHEVSHQWFGNLVTMRWFDDLWMKEGFATFMGYTLFESLEPGKHAWLRFHHRVKPRAYNVDGTSGTTPVYQKLSNLADAKSAYGAIVYNKAPAIIRELNHRLGPATFQAGLQLFLKRHEFANAAWQDLVTALEEAAKTSAAHWSNRWILAPGMPRVNVSWTSADEKIQDFAIHQESVQGDSGTWPLEIDALLLDEHGAHNRVRVVTDAAVTKVAELIGKPTPACVLLNPDDVAYGQFLLDERSRSWLVANAEKIDDRLIRAVAMTALWETVREAQLDPAKFVDVAIRLIQGEKDAGTHAWLLGRLRTSLSRYMPSAKSREPLAALTRILITQLSGDTAGIKTQTLRFLMSSCPQGLVKHLCEAVAAGTSPVAGLTIGKRDRFLAATALLATGRRDALDRLLKDYGGEDVARETYIAGAADPDAKARYFEDFNNLDEPPEQWVSISLGNFHWPGQEAKTLPYLRQALERVEWVKKNRKVFFMPAWIDAFVNGHSSEEALDVANRFLAEYSSLPIDIRRKILQSLDSLQRAVKIKRRWK